MPKQFRRKRTTFRRRKTYKKRTPVLPMVRTLALTSGFPKLLKVKHRYGDSLALTASTSNNTYLFSANGMFDPDISGIGHQPMYFDQLGLLYNKYTVIGSKITYKFTNYGASPPTNVAFMINDNTGTAVANPSGIAEQSSGKGVYLLPPGGQTTLVATQMWSRKKTFGFNGLNNLALSGTASANPTEQSYFQIVIRPQDLVTSTSVAFDIMIEYIAIWSEIIDVAQS